MFRIHINYALDDDLLFHDQVCKCEAIEIILFKVWRLKKPPVYKKFNICEHDLQMQGFFVTI